MAQVGRPAADGSGRVGERRLGRTAEPTGLVSSAATSNPWMRFSRTRVLVNLR